MRGDGACGRAGAIGAAGFVANRAGGCGGAGGGGVTETGASACATGGVATVEWTGCAATGIVGGVTADAGGWATGGAGAENVGLGIDDGTTTLGAGTAAAEAGGGGAFTVETGGAIGEAAARGWTEGVAALTGACCLRMAFRTSPGREILERSILVLISSLSTRLGRECFVDCASLVARK